MTFTASSNILLDNSNSPTSSSLDEDSENVFTCNRNEMSARDKTHRGIKKNSVCMTSWNEALLISSRSEIQFE